MRQKGNNFVEYALMLGLVVGIGWGVLVEEETEWGGGERWVAERGHRGSVIGN